MFESGILQMRLPPVVWAKAHWKNLAFASFLCFVNRMPAAKAISAHGLSFEDGLRRMLNTPPPPSSKSAKKAAAKKPRRQK
jgi:hypothetical protein